MGQQYSPQIEVPFPFSIDDRERDRDEGFVPSIRAEMLALWQYLSPETYAAFQEIANDPEEQFGWALRIPPSREKRSTLRQHNRELRRECDRKFFDELRATIKQEMDILHFEDNPSKKDVRWAKSRRDERRKILAEQEKSKQQSAQDNDDLFRQRLIEAVNYPALVELHPVDVITNDHVGKELFLEDFIGSRVFRHSDTGDLMLGQRFKLPHSLASTMVPSEILNGNRQHNGQWAIAMALGEGSFKIVEDGMSLRLHRMSVA